MVWRNNCIMIQLKNINLHFGGILSSFTAVFSPRIKNVHFQVGSTTCAEQDIKASTDLTSFINSAGLLSLKELPKGAEGHHPPSLPARFSLWQKRVWTKPQSVNQHKHLPLRETKSRNGDSGEAGDQLSGTVPLLSGDRGFSSALTPSSPRATRAAQPCPEFKLGVSPSCAKLHNQSQEEKLVMELISATSRSETEFSASSTYPMYLTTQRKQKNPKHQKNPKPQTKRAQCYING